MRFLGLGFRAEGCRGVGFRVEVVVGFDVESGAQTCRSVACANKDPVEGT